MKPRKLLLTAIILLMAANASAQMGRNDVKDPLITNQEEFNKFVQEHTDGSRSATDGGYDQLIKNTSPISPQAEALQKFGEFPMDYSTGVPQISIPLYEIKVGQFSFPISIVYHASGIKVQDMATPVGLGWTLSAGGVVNRQCKGIADVIQNGNLQLDYKTESQIDTAMSIGSHTNYWWSRLAHKGQGDTESDRYTYSINGKSGVFRYCVTDTTIRTIPTSDVRIEHITNGGYKITDSDGTKYYFTYGETNSDFNSSTLTAVTTWYLTRIEPSTSTIPITFSYISGKGYTMSYITQMDNTGTSYEMQQNIYGDYDLVENPYYSDSYQSYGGLYHGTVLLSQIAWAGDTITFNYSQDRSERGWNLDRLTSMTVKNINHATIRTVTFDNNHYLGNAQSNYRMLLEGVTIQGSSSIGAMTYGFSYNNTPLPNYFIIGSDQNCHEDYWGYYNGTSSGWIPTDSYLTTYSSSNRAPNSYMTAGILTGIQYPTGGTTTFVMEPNVLNDNRTWGGLRVSSITNKDANNNIISHKTYQYEQGIPAQEVDNELFQYDVDYYYGYRDIRGLQSNIGEHTIHQSSPILSLTGDWGHPMYYKKVTEFISGLGKTEYYYDVKRPSLNNMDDNAHIYDPLRLYSTQYNFDQGILNPVLTNKIVYASAGVSIYSPKSSESYIYAEVLQTPFRLGVRFEESNVLINYGGIAVDDAALDYSDYHHEFIYSDVWAVPSFFKLSSKTVTDYNNEVSTTTTYSYDSIWRTHQPVVESVTASNGDIIKTCYTYPATASGSTYDVLKAANIHTPVGTKSMRGSAVVDSTWTTYVNNSGLYLPSSLYIAKGTNTPEQRIKYAYDSFGNLAYAVKDDTIKTVFLWGYHGLHPVAKIEGMAKQDVYTALGNTITTLAGNPSDSQVHGIHSSLSSGLVTTYAWKPLVGITSMQSPRGENTYFTYDTMGRLASIHDHNHNVIEGYTYNYGTQSYVRRYTITGTGGNSYRETTDYYDAIGRLSETVAKGQSPTGQDLVTLTEYDALNRPIRQWLPTVFSNTGSYISPSTYTSGTRTYYESDSKPYSLTEYEQCPSDKVLKQFGPGSDWQNNNHAVKKVYRGNNANDSCRIYQVVSDSSLMSTGIYPAGELFTIQTSSEDDNVSYTFTDKEGRLVLERRMNDNARYDTYYVYDLYGNLAFVLPPAASDALKTTNTTWYITNNTVLQQYAYNYQYDSRNRCIKKYLPGCDYIAMTYDIADRMVTRQDGNQRNPDDSKTYYEYDSFGRQTVMGIQTASGYQTPLLTNYYDDYFGLNITGLGYDTSNGGDPAFSSSNAKGLLTGTKIAQLNNTSAEYYTSYYYGKRERLVQSHVQNYLGGLDHEFMTYNFTGTVATRKHIHTATGQSTQTELYTHSYDGVDRLLSTTHKLNNNTSVTLTLNTYDEVGRLATKKPLNIETVTYGYNVRNWLQRISSTHFDQILSYNTTPTGGLSPTYPKFDGSISAMTWRTGNDTDVWGYRFRYYPTGWLRSSTTRLNGSRVHDYDTFYDYDKMGNMTEFYRWGVVDKSLDLYDTVDYPTITYSGNRPTRIDDQDYSLTYPYNGGYHFIDYVQQNSEYTYDDNGNMKQDLNKRISSIQYNLLNLPQNITYSTGSTIAYTYDAAGKKLHVAYGSPSSTTDYCGNMIYENGALKQILIDDGYVTFSGTTPVYHYYLKDHQGNNRVVMNASGTIEQVNHYFPFGYLYGESTNSGVQPYKYNGKEFDMMHGLHWYDYGARHYDPCIMRFTTMDPMCEKYYHLSPYAYCGNNPVNAVDPSGMDWYQNEENQYYTWFSGNEKHQGYTHIGKKGTLLGEFEGHINQILINVFGKDGMYSEGFTMDIVDNNKGALLGKDKNNQNLLDEFVNGTGPEFSVFLSDHPYTQSMKSAKDVLKAQNSIKTNKTDIPGQITGFGGQWGIFDALTTFNMAKQFIGSYRYDAFTSEKDPKTLNNIISDSKNLESLLYHITPKSWNHSRESMKHFGNTYQFYIWKSKK